MNNKNYNKILKWIKSKNKSSLNNSFKLNNLNQNNSRNINYKQIIEVKEKEINKLNWQIEYLKHGITYRDVIIKEQNDNIIKLKEKLKAKQKNNKKLIINKSYNKVDNIKVEANKNFEKIEIDFLIKNICEKEYIEINNLYKSNKYIKLFHNILKNENNFSKFIKNVNENDITLIFETFKVFNCIFKSITHINNNSKIFIKEIPKIINLNFFKEQCETICNIIMELLKCDRASIFIYDKNKNEFWSQSIKNVIFTPADKGIIGEVYKHKKIYNVKDVDNCDFFNNDVDIKENYKTRNILAIPILDINNNCISVIEFINKIDGIFNKEDEGFLMIIRDFIKQFLENTLLNNNYGNTNIYIINKYKNIMKFVYELNFKYDEIEFFNYTSDYLKKFFDSNICLFYFFKNKQIYTYKQNNKKYYKLIGIIGNSLKHKKLLAFFNTNQNKIFNSNIDINTSLPTLTYPIIYDNKVLAIFQVQNLKIINQSSNKDNYYIDKYELQILNYLEKFIIKGINNIN